MTRGDIVTEAMLLSIAEWDRLHEWFWNKEKPTHAGDPLTVSKTGMSDYAVAYAAYAADLASITRFQANPGALALVAFGEYFEVTGE